MAPEEGFEPSANRLTADRSTTELLGNVIICGCRARIRTWAKGFKVLRATTTQLGNETGNGRRLVPEVGLEPTQESPPSSF